MAEWVAWVEPVDKQSGLPLLDPPRRYVAPMFGERTLVKHRGSAARFDSEETALQRAEAASRYDAPFGVEEIPDPKTLGS